KQGGQGGVCGNSGQRVSKLLAIQAPEADEDSLFFYDLELFVNSGLSGRRWRSSDWRGLVDVKVGLKPKHFFACGRDPGLQLCQVCLTGIRERSLSFSPRAVVILKIGLSDRIRDPGGFHSVIPADEQLDGIGPWLNFKRHGFLEQPAAFGNPGESAALEFLAPRVWQIEVGDDPIENNFGPGHFEFCLEKEKVSVRRGVRGALRLARLRSDNRPGLELRWRHPGHKLRRSAEQHQGSSNNQQYNPCDPAYGAPGSAAVISVGHGWCYGCI